MKNILKFVFNIYKYEHNFDIIYIKIVYIIYKA